MSDEALLSSWRQKDASAGELLFDRHYETVRRFFRNKVPPEAMRDLMHQVFAACIEEHTRFPQRSTFRTYLLGIAHLVMIDHLRGSPGRQAGQLDLTELILEEVNPTGGDAIAAKRERRLLLRALRNLRFPLQVALELRFWESMSDAEIAEVLDEPLDAVKTRLRTGRTALEAQLAELAGSPEELRSTLDSLHRWATRVRQATVPATARERDERHRLG